MVIKIPPGSQGCLSLHLVRPGDEALATETAALLEDILRTVEDEVYEDESLIGDKLHPKQWGHVIATVLFRQFGHSTSLFLYQMSILYCEEVRDLVIALESDSPEHLDWGSFRRSSASLMLKME
jgi:hypothetical protein